jgi:hypothetical protein
VEYLEIEEEHRMAQTTTSRLPLFEDVRQSVKRMQAEGERLVGRIRHDARTFFTAQRNGRGPVTSALTDVSKLRADVRRRAERALKEIGSRRERVLATVEEQLARLTELTVKRLRLATHEELEGAVKRISDLERRLETLAKQQKSADKAA